MKLLGKINYLAGGLASGDFAPTKQQREVHALFKQQLTALRQQLDAVLNQDLMALNKLLSDSNIKTILATDSTDKHR
jgi:sensor domain CHASE-containing protein